MDIAQIAEQLQTIVSSLGVSESSCLEQIAPEYLRQHARTRKKRTVEEVARQVAWLVERHGTQSVDGSWSAVGEAIIGHYGPQRAAARNMLRALIALLRYAERKGYRRGDHQLSELVRGLYRRPVRRPLSCEQMRGLLAACDGIDKAKYSGIDGVRLLVLCPLRIDEAAMLEWEGVDLAGRRLFLRDSKTGPRSVPLSGAAVSLLDSLPRSGSRVIGRHRDTIRHAWGLAAEAAGVRGTPHIVRHTWSTIGMRLGIPTAVRAAILGHSTNSMSITDDVYTYVDDSDVDEAVEKITAAILGT